jgi:hypothetical protein
MVLGVLGLAGTLAPPAFADDFSGFRLGANISSESMESDLFYTPFNATESNNNNRFAYGLFAGWGLNRYLAFEVGLRSGSEFNADHFEDRMTANPENYISAHTELWGLEGSVVGSVWIGDKISFFARAGMFGWQADQLLSVGNVATDTRPAAKTVTSVEDDGFNPLFGVGVQSTLDGALIRLEYRQTELEDLSAPGVFSVTDIKLESFDFSIVWIF